MAAGKKSLLFHGIMAVFPSVHINLSEKYKEIFVFQFAPHGIRSTRGFFGRILAFGGL